MTKEFLLPSTVLYVIRCLKDAGYQIYIVGGATRNLLLQKPVYDWDFTTNATPEQIQSLLPNSFYDNAFGTVMISPIHIHELMKAAYSQDELKELDVFDITTFRSESGYSNKRHPDKVIWGKSLKEDMQRRDFTINAMALDIEATLPSSFASMQSAKVTLIDYHRGFEDLQEKRVKAVGKADERFKEDALRMIRAIRFGSQLSFIIESDTLAAIQQNSQLIEMISGERIRTELLKILASDHPADGVLLLHSSGLLKHILPELEEGINIPQGGRHQYDVWKHSIESLRECPSSDPLVRLATLLHDVGKPRTMVKQGPRGVTFYGHEVVGAHMCNKIADRLRLSKKEKNKLFILVRWHMFTYSPEMTDSAVRRFIRRVSVENINDMMNLRIGDRKGGGSKATSWRLRELQTRIGENLYEPMSVKDLQIDGNQIMELLQIPPSRIVGQILNQLFEEVMEDTLPNEFEKLKQRALELSQQT